MKKSVIKVIIPTHIKVCSDFVKDVYWVSQDKENHRFYIRGNNGYNGFEGDGFTSFVGAFEHAKKLLLDDVRNFQTTEEKQQ